MKYMKSILLIILCMGIVVSLCGCPIHKDTEDAQEKIDTNFNAITSISYSSGSDNNWSYGNQRKEFPRYSACYARVGSTIAAEKKKGVGTEITITYTFTGTDNCKVELSDGIATLEDGSDPNTQVFKRTITAEKEKKATEDFIVFQYMPNGDANSITIKVTYDDHVPNQYDERNTVYFCD